MADTAPSSAAAGILNVIVGTAGHIDHGKSSLVEKLTGIDPDRLAEEKERGMTIDLGFARVQLGGRLVGLIDVPGHERFIKNMVAGATSVDVVLLVVAADDGVMPQTVEHLEILRLLNIRSGMVAVTKSDLVDPELLELAVEDVRQLVQGTFLEESQVIPCSTVSEEGLEAVKAELERLVLSVKPHAVEGLFRMPIQRVFSAKGHGTVVTGVPLSGSLQPSDEVQVQPLGKKGKVRNIQAYGQDCDRARAGHSCALNLSDLDYREVHRGMVAASPGFFEPATLLEGRLNYLKTRSTALEHREEIRFHSGTTEVIGRVRIIDAEALAPGESGLVQLELEEPVVACAGDHFLIRQPSPMMTLGGGVLFGPARHHRRRLKDHHIEALQERELALQDLDKGVAFAARQRRFEPFRLADLAVDLGRPASEIEGRVGEQQKLGTLLDLGRGQLLSKEFVDQARKKIVDGLKTLHKNSPLKKFLELRALRGAVELPEGLFKAVVQLAVQQGLVAEEGNGLLRLASHQPAISAKDEQLLQELRATLATAEFKPPGLAEMADKLGEDSKHLRRLLDLLGDEGEVVRVGSLYVHRRCMQEARKELVANARAHEGQVAIPELRDKLQTTRKYMIPLLEYFDSTRLTVRRGDHRFLHEEEL